MSFNGPCDPGAARSNRSRSFSNRILTFAWIEDANLSIFAHRGREGAARTPSRIEYLIGVTLQAQLFAERLQIPNFDGHVVAGGQQNILGHRMESNEIDFIRMGGQFFFCRICRFGEPIVWHIPQFNDAIVAGHRQLICIEWIPLEVHDIAAVD